MAARVAKHDHTYKVISHTEDWLKVLVMCSICPDTQAWTPKKKRVNPEEFRRMTGRMEHRCCQIA